MSKIADIVLNTFLEILKGGVPWFEQGFGNNAINWATRTVYSGVNAFILPKGQYISYNAVHKNGLFLERTDNSRIVLYKYVPKNKGSKDKTPEDVEDESNKNYKGYFRYFRVYSINNLRDKPEEIVAPIYDYNEFMSVHEYTDFNEVEFNINLVLDEEEVVDDTLRNYVIFISKRVLESKLGISKPYTECADVDSYKNDLIQYLAVDSSRLLRMAGLVRSCVTSLLTGITNTGTAKDETDLDSIKSQFSELPNLIYEIYSSLTEQRYISDEYYALFRQYVIAIVAKDITRKDLLRCVPPESEYYINYIFEYIDRVQNRQYYEYNEFKNYVNKLYNRLIEEGNTQQLALGGYGLYRRLYIYNAVPSLIDELKKEFKYSLLEFGKNNEGWSAFTIMVYNN